MQKVFLVLFVGVLGVFISNQAMKTSVLANDVLLANVEALANTEATPPTTCFGEGDFTCPIYGIRVEDIYIGYSLR